MRTSISGPSTDSGDAFPPLKDEEYSLFARILNSGTTLSNSTDRISSQSFKKGLLKYGIINREDDAVIITLEINSSGGDLLVSSIRGKVFGKDLKLSNLLKRYIRTVLDNQHGRTRDRVLGKIISRAGETMTPELNLLRSPMNAYKYVDGESALLDDVHDDIIDIVPSRQGVNDPNPPNQKSHIPETVNNTRNSIHGSSSHSSSRDRVLGKIISHAVTSLEKSSTPSQGAPSSQPVQEVSTHPIPSQPHHSSRDRVLAKIISNAVGTGNYSSSDTPHLPPIAKHSPRDASKANHKSSREHTSDRLVDVERGENDFALQDYEDQPPSQRKSFSRQESKSEPRRRATYDPEKHSSLYASSEYLQVDMSTDSETRNVIDRDLSRRSSREDSKPRRHSENSICNDPEILEQMKSVRQQDSKQSENFHNQQLPHSPSKNLKPANNGRVRNKILNRMVNRVKETVLSTTESSTQRPLSGRKDQESETPPLKVKEKSSSPIYDSNGKWFHPGRYSSTVAIDNTDYQVYSPSRDSYLRVHTVENRAEAGMKDPSNSNVPNSKLPVEHKDASGNPLRHILSDAHLIIPPNDGSFSPGGNWKSSPLHLTVSTPLPYQGTYRRTVNHHSPDDRPWTPEPDVESCDGNENKSSEWNRHEGKETSTTPHSRDKWVGAAPVQAGRRS